MMHVKKLALAATAVACVTGVLAGPAAASAAPQSLIELPFTRPADVVATGDRVFVSGGRDASQIVVADAAGTVTGVLDGLAGPTDLQLSNDRRTLYVALSGADAIAAFDTASLRESARYRTGAGACPSTLAISGRYLWFGYGCGQWDSEIGRVDLRRSTVATGLAGETFYAPPLLAAARRNPGVLLASDTGLTPSQIWSYTVGTGGTLTPAEPAAFDPARASMYDIALDPAGTIAYTAAPAPYAVQAYAMSDLTQPIRAYDTGPYPRAVELTRDGTRIAAAAQTRLLVFTADGSLTAQTDLAGPAFSVVRGGLAWAPNGRRLYAVTYNLDGPGHLHVVEVATG